MAATSASFIVIRSVTHAKFMTAGIDKHHAFGLKSEPSATGTPVRPVCIATHRHSQHLAQTTPPTHERVLVPYRCR